LRAEDVCELLQRVIQQGKADLESGALISVQENRIRVRRLPIS
jgi:hypothetical protein